MIQAQSLTKRYGSKTAVDSVDFTVQPGKVTGFLGPNGAGKSTTMRMIVGLDKPTSGSVIVNGKAYREHKAPLREVGMLLDAKAVHTGRSAYNHLRALAATHSIPASRVDEVIALTGLESVARKRVGGFSLGMGQRLGIAAALLGDPATLILDEPINGLDPEGVLWVRRLARQLAREGRTVLLSSHLMSEMALTADHLIVLGRGRVIADAPVADIIASANRTTVRVRTPNSAHLANLLAQADVTVTNLEQDLLEIVGVTAVEIGDQAARAGIILHELTPVSASLEEAYMTLTQDEVEYRTGGASSTIESESATPALQEAAR
ncbi:ABC transporter ATP-binding protein [Cryobacterium psychrophilum]|uniref:ATP-binding cassette domain-containing protein n=1 Tax=Cryobacterium psychrophilum TaxID=41988 RepID=A0A4Y8KMA1_9MICO|nr:ATP-binding cassette domain-containing protein [Cryobacterium psychrophilum]TDW29969.1 ABC-2 type transport system ATP-binding protein [Cryobacterium psychrophilum]TFD76527.1 ATP-binding cassette domain-containing protein [Cryobacterium psychrophilum]